MENLDKETYNYIKTMIATNEGISSIKAFCQGFGLDVNSYSSPIHISNDTITIRYRRANEYINYTYSKIYGTKFY